jgi:hypothetical protein
LSLTATIEPSNELVVSGHVLGDLVAIDAAATMFGVASRIETFAMAGDSVDFLAGEHLFARRYRHDHWPTAIASR